jgi:hypothetical protein
VARADRFRMTRKRSTSRRTYKKPSPRDGSIGVPPVGTLRFNRRTPGSSALRQTDFQAFVAVIGRQIQYQKQFRGQDDLAQTLVTFVGGDFVQAERPYKRKAALESANGTRASRGDSQCGPPEIAGK